MPRAKTTAAKGAEKQKATAQTGNLSDLNSGLNAMADSAVQQQGNAALDEMAENAHSLHAGLHDMHDAAMHAEGDIHDADSFPQNWKPPAELEAPPARAGFVQRWIRMSMFGKADANNMADQGRQGWRPRTLESVPDGDRKQFPTMKDPRSSGQFLVNKDLVLCEMPQRLFDQMRAHYQGKARGLVDAMVDKPLAQDAVAGSANHGMGAPYVAERSTKVTTGRSPIVAAD